MKKHLFKTFLSVFIMVSVPSFAQVSGGAAGANAAQLQSLVGGAASGAYAVDRFTRCYAGWGTNWSYCAQGVLAISQALQMYQTARSSHGVAMTLSNGGDGSFDFNPDDAGFCFDPATGCDPDGIDANLSGFQNAFETGEGYEDALAAAEQSALDQLKEAQSKGLKVDLDAGTMTDPNGNVTNLSDSSLKIPSSLSKAATDKIAGINKALGNSSRGVASVGVASAKKGSLDLFKGFEKKPEKMKKKDGKGRFLAGLSDKDAGKNGVGFAGDDIFNMIQRRYTKKIDGKEFIGK